ncbi:signal peptidase I SipW [Jeotgalibacillus salarius]|uniref:Signal peptidase I n=1 Tax=Jeotgalibacillus salarius TaxID=546023 RepID=A0A4Y8LNM9_9BACL|nr:signal peptidase I [Jeotgalibacillus salarius]TFE04017.1 signal peptidase I [Jeotgalibacillus salarius]
MKVALKLTSHLISLILFTVFVLILFIVVSARASGGEPEFLGYQLKTVLSGSMEPGIQTGSVIAVEKVNDAMSFEIGDVITYMEDEQRLTTHRITDVIQNGEHTMFQTKGDNNEEVDANPVMAENVVAKYTGVTVPYIGYFLNTVNSKNGAFIFIGIGAFLLLYSIFTIWRAIAQVDLKSKREEANVS